MKEFELIYREYYDVVFRYLLKLTGGDLIMAEDLTQETFFQAFTAIYRFNGKSQLSTWLCAIGKNCYLKYMRKNREVPYDIQVFADSLASEQNVHDEVEVNEQIEILRREIGKLEGREKDVMFMRTYLDYSFKEIAKMLHMKESTAKVIYHRAKEKLKGKLI